MSIYYYMKYKHNVSVTVFIKFYNNMIIIIIVYWSTVFVLMFNK